MITLSNGHSFDYVVASGSLAFDGRGWPWEHPLRWAGLLRPELFTVVTKTLTRTPRAGHLRWWRPWSCVRLWNGHSMVNKVGLTNPGIDWWRRKVGPALDPRIPLVGSIHGDPRELAEMARMLDEFPLVGIEVNPSCPNTGQRQHATDAVVAGVEAARAASRHPVFCKLSVAQDCVDIARRLEGVAEALSFNSVPWEIVYPPEGAPRRSPLWRLDQRVGGGGGGVSGTLAQEHNWRALGQIVRSGCAIPTIASSIMEYDDLACVRSLGARAVSFGSIHMRTPWKPTAIVRRDMFERNRAGAPAGLREAA